MSKKSKDLNLKSNLSVPEIGKEMIYCMTNNLIVYPVEIKNKWYIQVDSNNIFYKRFLTEKENIQESIYKTWVFYYNKLKKLENV